MIHRTTIDSERARDPERARQCMAEALVSLYRRSQAAGESGRIFLIRQSPTVLGLQRTNDAEEIASLLRWRDMFGEAIREVDEHEIRIVLGAP